MAAQPQTKAIEGVAVTSTPLPPFRALDLLPELGALMDSSGVSLADNDGAMFVALARNLGGGKLRKLLPELFAGTKIAIPESTTPLLINTPEAIDLAFDGRMNLLAPALAFALEVSFRDFFAGLALAVKDLKARAS